MPFLATLARNLFLITTLLLVAPSPADEHSQPRTAEQEILAALDQMTVCEFIEEPSTLVLEYFAKLHNIEIQLDVRAIEQPCMGVDTPITKSLRNVTLRSALNQILGEVDLAWVITNEVLLVTTPEEAELFLTTRVYDLGKLATTVDSEGNTKQDFAPLVRAIVETIEPESWEETGGFGSIVPLEYAGAAVLIVSQTHEMHDRLAGFLEDLFTVAERNGENVRPTPDRNPPPAAVRNPGLKTAEQEFLATLDQTMAVDFIEEPLSGVAEYLSKLHCIQIQIDTRALEDVNMGLDIPATRSLRNVTLRSALNLILGDLDLTWIIQDEVLLITTPEEAERHLLTRVYDVGTLVTVQDEDGRVWHDLDTLREAIIGSIDPVSWNVIDGPGRIGSLQCGKASILVVSQTRTIQNRIANLLEDLLRVAGKYEDKHPTRAWRPPKPPGPEIPEGHTAEDEWDRF